MARTAEENAQRMRVERAYAAAVRAAQRPPELAAPKPHAKRAKPLRPFIGVDGEGSKYRDRWGRQHYMLLRIGDRELYTGKPLTTGQCLNHILAAPPPRKAILVGFVFNYDATMILRDLCDGDPEKATQRIRRLFAPRERKAGVSPYTFWKGYGIEYLPGKFLRVCRMRRGKAIRGTARTILDTSGFFQTSFRAAIEEWGVGLQHHKMIEAMKQRRAVFDRMTAEVRHYNAIECELLAELMTRFRDMCIACGLPLRNRDWNGAGKLAQLMHTQHATIRRDRLAQIIPAEVMAVAAHAYYGGRFETVLHGGPIAGPVFEYDINSAYPAAMRSLPCLEHGRWIARNPRQLAEDARQGALFLAWVSFTHPAGKPLCGLPVRQDNGKLFWPREGQGTYWSIELASAERLGAAITYREGWLFRPGRCNCPGFDWVAAKYAERKQLDAIEAGRGKPLKLGINALYGKQAQRVGEPTFGNFIHAGIITASCRAQLNDAIALSYRMGDPGAIVMLATDAVLSTRPLRLPIGPGLGQWEEIEHGDVFIVQPGLYWGGKRPKTRGLPSDVFKPETQKRFEAAWRKWFATHVAFRAAIDMVAALENGGLPPAVPVGFDMFIPLKLAAARGKPRLAGCWIDAARVIDLVQGREEGSLRRFSFFWKGKRSIAADFTVDYPSGGRAIRTMPDAGGPDLVSRPHSPDAPWIEDYDLLREAFGGQPDFVNIPVKE